MKKMLILLHCLLPGGSINVVFTLTEVLQRMGYQLEVASRNEGPMRWHFESKGIPVTVWENMMGEDFLSYIVENYQEVLVNTLPMYDVISRLNYTGIKVHWWIHEPPIYFQSLEGKMSQQFWDGLKNNITVYAAGDFVHDWIVEQYGYKTEILNFGIEENLLRSVDSKILIDKDKITFLIPSIALWYAKGQDIMLAAIAGLSKEYADKAEFIFTGQKMQGQEDYYDVIVGEAQKLDCIRMFPIIERSNLLQLMQQVDCIAAPSREDATNACIVEGLMLSKLCLCSDRTGVSRYMEDCVNGFVFQSGNVEELRARIMLIIHNFDRLEVIAKKGRNVYEKNFSMEVFERNVRKYWGY